MQAQARCFPYCYICLQCCDCPWNLGALQFRSSLFRGTDALSFRRMLTICSSLGAGHTHFSGSDRAAVTVTAWTCVAVDCFSSPFYLFPQELLPCGLLSSNVEQCEQPHQVPHQSTTRATSPSQDSQEEPIATAAL